MHFSRRFLSALLVVVLLVGLLFHGHFAEIMAQNKTETVTDTTESVRIWYSDDSLTDYFTNAAVAFHEQNPDIRVIPVLVSSSEYLDTVYEQSIAGEDYPDIYITSNDSLEKAYLSGIAATVQDNKAVNHEHFSQAAIDAVTYSKQIIAYPLFFETSVLAFNRTYLENWAEAVNSGAVSSEEGTLSEEDLKQLEESGELDISEYENEEVAEEGEKEPVTADSYIPKDINELLDFAGKYDAPDEVNAVFKWDVTDVFYNYFFVGDSIVVGGPAGDDIQNLDIYNANTISCLEVYQNLNQFFSIDAKTSNYTDVVKDFTEGKSVFTVVTSDAIKKIRESQKEALDKYKEADELARNEAAHRSQIEAGEAMAAGISASSDEDDEKSDSSSSSSASSSENSSEEAVEEEKTELQKEAEALKAKVFDFDFARIPMVSDKLNSKSLSVTNALVVNGFSKHMTAAHKFAKFATTTYCGSLYQKSGKVAASLDANYEDADLKVFQEEYANSIPLPKMMEASNLWVQLEVLFTKIWDGEDIQSLVVDLSKQIANQTVETEE